MAVPPPSHVLCILTRSLTWAESRWGMVGTREQEDAMNESGSEDDAVAKAAVTNASFRLTP